MALPATELERYPALPRYLTRFTGREAELERLRQLFGNADARLITIIGPGGVGKTRLLAESLAGGSLPGAPPVIFFDGAAHPANTAVMPALARSLSIEQHSEDSFGGQVSEYLADRSVLLVMDNLEHLPTAPQEIAILLRACPGIRIAATSRTPLRLSHEHLLTLQPLPLEPAAQLSWSPAADLFADRARLVNHAFLRSEDDIATLESICRQLDGVPLAIELAAARLRILSLDALHALLGRQLSVLGGGAVDLAPRHRTLHDAIAWSYDLLDVADQRLFRSLGIFRDAFTLEAVEAVGFSDVPAHLRPGSALDALTTLFDQSLIQQQPPERWGETRFRMLVSIRELAQRLLDDSDEQDGCFDRMTAYALELVERNAGELTGPRQAEAIATLHAERESIRIAFEWAAERSDSDTQLRLVAGLWRFWANRGLLRDARHEVVRVLAGKFPQPTATWGGALRGAAVIAELQSDWTAARDWGTQAIAIWEELGDSANLARSLVDLGNVESTIGAFDEAQAAFLRALEQADLAGDRRMSIVAQCSLGNLALRQGRHTEAIHQFDAAIPAMRSLGDQWTLAMTLTNNAIASIRAGRGVAAISMLQESLVIRRELGDVSGIAASLITLEEARGADHLGGEEAREALRLLEGSQEYQLIAAAHINLALGALRVADRETAGALLGTALANYRLANNPVAIAETVDLIAELAEPCVAARLQGGAAACRELHSVDWKGPHAPRAQALDRRIERQLGHAAYSDCHGSGAALDLTELVFEAIQVTRKVAQPVVSPEYPATLLTVRERMVLQLIVDGKSDREIGAELFISPKTANRHVSNILAKLECRNRIAATAKAIQLGLLAESAR